MTAQPEPPWVREALAVSRYLRRKQEARVARRALAAADRAELEALVALKCLGLQEWQFSRGAFMAHPVWAGQVAFQSFKDHPGGLAQASKNNLAVVAFTLVAEEENPPAGWTAQVVDSATLGLAPAIGGPSAVPQSPQFGAAK